MGPYSLDELRLMRRLILALGIDISIWCQRLRRSAAYLQSLSPEQARIVVEQASAIAADPTDYGGEEALEETRRQLETVAAEERATYVWREIVDVRRRHYPGQLGA